VSKDDVFAIFAICDSVAEAQAILHDHLECGKHSPAEALAKLQRVLSEDGLLRALYDVGYFPPTTPPVSAQSALRKLLLPMKDAILDEVLK
jgi:hypothetical protein